MGLEMFELFSPEEVGKKAAEQALVNLRAGYCNAGQMTVAIENGFGGVIFHEACGHSLEATGVAIGMSEMCGPGVAFECTEQNGLHIWEDYYIVEIVDPETLEPVPEGEVGELVLTTINREAMPLLRYRTRDLTRILPGECPCGRHHARLDRMKGRSDDMIILKGVNIFPIQIETILLQFKELSTDYLITLETVDTNDEMTIEVELNELFTDDYARLQALTREITRQLKDEILVTPRIKLMPKGALPKSEGKAVRVKDLRKTF
jgi:phenylacetate-CoA ligase